MFFSLLLGQEPVDLLLFKNAGCYLFTLIVIKFCSYVRLSPDDTLYITHQDSRPFLDLRRTDLPFTLKPGLSGLFHHCHQSH